MIAPRPFCAAFAAFLFAALAVPNRAAHAQNSNAVSLLSNIAPGTGYNDCWGYRSPSGIELALMGDQNGTWFINATDPTQPTVVSFLPGPSSTWRDIKTYENYAYIVTEGGGGMQIVDLSNPLAPVHVRTWGTSFFGNAHNIFIDVPAGIAYACGTNVGIVVIDLRNNPSNPTRIRNWNNVYVHDLHVQNGLAHLAAINAGEYWIVDVSALPTMTVLSQVRTPGTFCHNTGVSADDRIAVTSDESAGGHLGIWDIADPRNPVKLAEYTANSSAIIHNAYVVGNFVHISYYTEGYRLVDITDPSRPFEAGYYDTYPGSSGGYNGQWGCFPYQPSGVVYSSDRSTGLYIFRPDPISVTHAPLGDTTDEDNARPIILQASSAAGLAPQGATLRWRVTPSGIWNQIAMTPGSQVGEFLSAIPAIAAPTIIEYGFTFQFASSSGVWPGNGSEGFRYRVGSIRALYFEDFENGWNGWTHTASFGSDDWEIGTPQGKSTDPGAAFSGTECVGTDLGFGANDGAYSSNSTSHLQSPLIQIGTRRDLFLRLRRWLSVEDASRDRTLIYANGLPIFSNTNIGAIQDSSWRDLQYNLNFVLGGAQSVVFRFELATDASGNRGGWNLDDIEISFLSDCMPPVSYGQGVAGSGALVPTLEQVGDPVLGNSAFALRSEQLLGGAPSALLISFAPANVAVLGVTLLVDPAFAITLPTVAQGSVGQPGVGTATWSAPIPSDGLLDGGTVYTQVLSIDAAGPLGVSSSAGLRVRVCADGQ